MKKTIGITASVLALAGCASMETGPKASATIRPASGSQVHGAVTFTQVGPNRVRVSGEIAGHDPGLKGLHIHEKGDCSAPDATSAGAHLNPAKAKHGPSPTAGHAGDLGNITFDAYGKSTFSFVLEGLTVSRDAPNGVIGRAVIVHMQADDLKSDPIGNAGGRAACGVIE